MAVKKKKKAGGAKLKKAKPNGQNGANGLASAKTKVGATLQVQTVQTFVDSIEGSLTNVQGLIESIESNVIFPQKLLEFGVLLERLSTLVSKTRKAFDKRAIGHRTAEGAFEHGKVAITFPETERRSPKWKDEATDRARQLAEAAGDEFDPKTFVAGVIEDYPATIIRKVRLTVSA